MQAPLDPEAMHLSGPIPGQSLTVAPGSVPWEKPPQYTTVDDALKYIIKQMQDPENVHRFLAAMEMGSPLDVTVWTLIQHGFMEGKWTPSLGMLLIYPLTKLFVSMLKRAKIKFLVSYNPKKGALDDLFAGIDQKQKQQKIDMEKVKAFEASMKTADVPDISKPAIPTGGLMSPAAQGATS